MEEVLYVGSKYFLEKEFKELLEDKRHYKIRKLRPSDPNYKIDKLKGKFVIVRR